MKYETCYLRAGNGSGQGTCWPVVTTRTRRVRLLVETMGGPSWQEVPLCDGHRTRALANGTAKAAR